MALRKLIFSRNRTKVAALATVRKTGAQASSVTFITTATSLWKEIICSGCALISGPATPLFERVAGDRNRGTALPLFERNACLRFTCREQAYALPLPLPLPFPFLLPFPLPLPKR